MEQDETRPAESITSEQKITIAGTSLTVAGCDREPFAEVIFGLHCIRTLEHTIVGLTLAQVDFGVRNCCTQNCSEGDPPCDKNCKSVFIRKMTIEVRPKSWAQGCSRPKLQPPHTAALFQLQRGSSVNVQMPLISPRQASVSFQKANSVLCVAPEFKWCPPHIDDTSKAVSFTWELYRYADGSKLDFNKPRWWSRPHLGIRQSHAQIQCEPNPLGASWKLQPIIELQQLEWDVTVSLYTAVSQRKGCLPCYTLTRYSPITSEKSVLAFHDRSALIEA